MLHTVLKPLLPLASTKRVRIAVIANDQEILLVRNWFGYQNWTLPGGGVKKGETLKQAAIRELQEETGLKASQEAMRYLGVYRCDESSNSFDCTCFYLPLKGNVSTKLYKNRGGSRQDSTQKYFYFKVKTIFRGRPTDRRPSYRGLRVRLEIIDSKWFRLTDLPADSGLPLAKIIALAQSLKLK